MSDISLPPFLELFFELWWPNLLAVFLFGLSLVASLHVIMNKRQPSAAISWSGLIWLSPFFGAVFYWILGINRIKRRALILRGSKNLDLTHHRQAKDELLPKTFARPFQEIAQYGHSAHPIPLTAGNHVEVYVNGDEAYPQMLEWIRQAKQTIFLSSYIFDNDAIGNEFVKALGHARDRGVLIRVLVDGTGSRYSFPSIMGKLKGCKIVAARFLPNFVPWHMAYLNLRNHRKLLIVDSHTAFTGGMNIRQGNLVNQVSPQKAICDLHFKVQGPVLWDMLKTFIEDWYFATGEDLQRFLENVASPSTGQVYARGLADGPDLEEERILGVILAALRAAKRSIRIMTPYFVPDTALVQSLTTAAMSGVDVEIIIPARNNLRIVGYATNAILPELLQGACQVFASAPPFDHSKIALVDDSWCMIGSSNWDTRSFRLNFEFNVECFDPQLTTQLTAIFNAKKLNSLPINRQDVEAIGPLKTLRNRSARLFSPYL